jgi:hypothetical protein
MAQSFDLMSEVRGLGKMTAQHNLAGKIGEAARALSAAGAPQLFKFFVRNTKVYETGSDPLHLFTKQFVH